MTARGKGAGLGVGNPAYVPILARQCVGCAIMPPLSPTPSHLPLSPLPSQMEPGGSESSLASPLGSLQSSPLDSSPLTLPTSCANGREDTMFPASVPHSWLCDGTLLCLHDASREDNMAAFQHQWRRGLVLTHSLTHSLTHPLTHTPTHPLTHSLTHTFCVSAWLHDHLSLSLSAASASGGSGQPAHL